MITLVLGGTRSGKSAVAERLAARSSPVTYVATGRAVDEEMAERIAHHRARRPAHWTTIECGPELAPALRSTTGTVLVDALGTWVAGHHDFEVDLGELLSALAVHRGDVIVVSDEVGLGVHPSSELGRAFRDALGTVNHAVAELADEVLLVVAGRVLPLGRFS
jgi:adenosylcobinamide kinase/adenosylcobinamide-phosphate guanylyltransferase